LGLEQVLLTVEKGLLLFFLTVKETPLGLKHNQSAMIKQDIRLITPHAKQRGCHAIIGLTLL